jgi:hypothetical protein
MSLLRIGEITTKPTKLNNTGKPYYIFTGATFDDNKIEPAKSYIDITSNKNWITLGLRYYDYLFCRNQVMSWTYAKTTAIGQPFSGLTQEDQEYAAMNFTVGQTERESVYTQSELQQHWNSFIKNANICRKTRWEEAKGYASFNLSTADSIDLAKTTNTLTEEYVTYGIEERSADGVDGLFDWVEDTGSFSGGTGFSSKSYYTTGLTQNIMTILRDGIY